MTVGKVRVFVGRVACHAYRKPTVTRFTRSQLGMCCFFVAEASYRRKSEALIPLEEKTRASYKHL
jgi:hypothetical protein